jgi:hypothetical protein
MKKAIFLLLVFSAVSAEGQSAQSVDLSLPAVQFSMDGLPQWARDLRRAEIVAFGSFPFTMFLATTIMDSWRYYKHGWDQRYAPWPIKGAGAIDMSAGEHRQVILYAALGSIALSITDFIIVQIKRNNARKRAESMPPGTPIIVRRIQGNRTAENGTAEDSAVSGPEGGP